MRTSGYKYVCVCVYTVMYICCVYTYMLCAYITVYKHIYNAQFSSDAQSCLFATPWTAACQASLSITISQSLLKLMSITSVMPSNHLILCHPLLLLSSVFLSIRVFSIESILCIRWPKYWMPSPVCVGLWAQPQLCGNNP